MSEADFGGGKQGSGDNGGSEGNKGKETAKEIDSGLISPTIRNPVQEINEDTSEEKAQNEVNATGVQGCGEDGGRGEMNKGKEKAESYHVSPTVGKAETERGSEEEISPDVVGALLAVKQTVEAWEKLKKDLYPEKKHRPLTIEEINKDIEEAAQRLCSQNFQDTNEYEKYIHLETERITSKWFESFSINNNNTVNQEEKDDTESSNTPAAAAVENKENEDEDIKIADQKEDNEESAADGN